jgi:hypothetical protein
MESNLINVNPQMQKMADNAVAAARDKFGISLDFTENSLQQLEMLLQQAHEGYKRASSNVNSQNISIENTVQVWGSYFGEVIRRSLGGDWIVDQKNVFLQLGSRRLDPLGQVRSRIVDGQLYNVQSYFQGWKSGVQENLVQKPIKFDADRINIQPSGAKKDGTKKRSTIYIAGASGIFILICIFTIGGWLLLRQGIIAIPIFENIFPKPLATIVPLLSTTNTTLPLPTATIHIAPVPTKTLIPTPHPLTFTGLSQSDLENAQLTPKELSFGGLYQADDWHLCSNNDVIFFELAIPDSYFDGLPSARLTSSRVFSTVQDCSDISGDAIEENIYILPDVRQAERFFSILSNECDYVALLGGSSDNQSFNDNDL